MKKVALVTGAASGIGLACAERLASDGCAVVIADVNEVAGREHASRLKGMFVKADLTQRPGCKNLVDEVLKKHGTVHILVNNAGYQHVAPIEEFPEDQWERMIFLMLTAPFLLTRYCWPAMKKQKWGRVVNIASIHALVASPFKVGYTSAKHGLVGLTRTAALEGGEHGITAARRPSEGQQYVQGRGGRENHARAGGGEAADRASRGGGLRRLSLLRRGRRHHRVCTVDGPGLDRPLAAIARTWA